METEKRRDRSHWGYLVCPETKQALVPTQEGFRNPTGKLYPITREGRVTFLSTQENQGFASQRDFLDQLKAKIKDGIGKYYILFVNTIAPIMPRISWTTGETYWKYRVRKYCQDKSIVLQLGSGNDRIHPRIVNLDIFPYPEVDVIADGRRLPYADNSVDGVVSSAVLEHVEDPEAFIQEAYRVIKPGGFILTSVPFMVGFHASPKDYYRWTHQGLESIHKKFGFVDVRVEPMGGPTSSLLWTLQEWLALIFSFGICPLYYAELMLFYILLFPLKLFDIVLIHHPEAKRICSLFFCEATKPKKSV